MPIYVITDKNTGEFIDVGTKDIVVTEFVRLNSVFSYQCKIFDDVGYAMGEIDLAATKLQGKIVRK